MKDIDFDSIGKKLKEMACVRFDQETKPGISNLMSIYGAITGQTMEQIQSEFEGKGYGDFKMRVGEAVVEELRPLQARFKELSSDKTYIDSIIKKNAETANYFATKTLRKVQKKVGFPPVVR